MKVPNDERVANDIGPESCAAAREGRREALTGVRSGWPLSRESKLQSVDAVSKIWTEALARASAGSARSETPAWSYAPCTGTGISCMSVRYLRLARGGKAMRPKSSMHGGKKSDPSYSSEEADEQRRASGGGAGGAKGRDQGERGPAKHAPDTEPDQRVTCAGTHTASNCRHPPEVGAVCGKAARTVLCGGRVMKHASLPPSGESSSRCSAAWRRRAGRRPRSPRLVLWRHPSVDSPPRAPMLTDLAVFILARQNRL